jgi:hypothetical protein
MKRVLERKPRKAAPKLPSRKAKPTAIKLPHD